MVSKRKRPEREWEWEELCEEVRSHRKLDPGVIDDIVKGTGLAAREKEELGKLILELAEAYVTDKAVEIAQKDMKMPPDIRDRARNPGHVALTELFVNLGLWWNQESGSTLKWNSMQFPDYDEYLHRYIGELLDPRTMLFVKVAQAIDDRVTLAHCATTRERGRKLKPWNMDPEQFPALTWEEVQRLRPNPPKPSRKR
jgi:hypothetical protein